MAIAIQGKGRSWLPLPSVTGDHFPLHQSSPTLWWYHTCPSFWMGFPQGFDDAGGNDIQKYHEILLVDAL
jgi:hypothetical protein